MSYARKLNILIVEDNVEAKGKYEEMLQERLARGEIAEPYYAFCYADAVEALNRDVPYHLAIVDLRIPEHAQEPAPEHADFGKAVLQLCEDRERWPIPAVLVVSGHLEPDIQADLEQRFATNFAYGKARVKGEIGQELDRAIEAVDAYLGVGIHEHVSSELQCPPHTPRELDLVRRLVMSQGCLGVDLEHWSATPYPSPGGRTEWGKVYVGRLWEQDYNKSSICFFKFMPRSTAQFVSGPTLSIERCLAHMKVFGNVEGGERSLIVTRKVGASDNHPKTLVDLLSMPASRVESQLSSVAKQVGSQLSNLGALKPDVKRYSEFLKLVGMPLPGGTAVDLAVRMMERYLPNEATAIRRVESKAAEFLASSASIRVTYRRGHGDLNSSNVALDIGDDQVEAYIFDPGSMQMQPAAQDLAMLEVTLLLHTASSQGSLVQNCGVLYGTGSLQPETDLRRNTVSLIRHIREEADKLGSRELYKVLLFNIAFGQVWGLSFGGSANKVKSPADAVRLLILITDWMESSEEGPVNVAEPLEPGF